MNKKKKNEKIRLTDHFTYQIIDNVIYLFQEKANISSAELKIVLKKVSLLIDDDDICYINISSKNIDKRKSFYQEIGFSLSYYSIEKLNSLYKGYSNKKDYRCYAFMTKTDFLNINNNEEEKKEDKKVVKKEKNKSNKGFVSSMLLLFGGIIFFCYLCVEGAILLIEMGR